MTHATVQPQRRAVDDDEPAPAWARQLLDEVRGLRQAIEGRRSLRRQDHALLVRLLPVAAATFGAELFTAREVIDHRAEGLRLVLPDGMSAKALGKLFRRAQGQVCGGHLVERLGDEGHVALWSVREVVEFPVVSDRSGSRGVSRIAETGHGGSR